MRCSRVVSAWLDRAESFGARPELIGDLYEEMAGGRTSGWLVTQLLVLAAATSAARVRACLRTPVGIRCSVIGLGLLAMALVPPGQLLQAWLIVYYLAGMLSLFAHMAAEHQLFQDAPDS
jgi:hypothetical protein